VKCWVCGLVGAGRTEAFEALIGLRKRTAGRIEIAGRRADLKSPRDACATASRI
jgi:ABC-type sugar transport system, ATPase component